MRKCLTSGWLRVQAGSGLSSLYSRSLSPPAVNCPRPASLWKGENTHCDRARREATRRQYSASLRDTHRAKEPAAAGKTKAREAIENHIRELIEERARPHAQSDGGDITFRNYDHEAGIVHVVMRGACAGCSSSTVTLKFMVLNLLQHYIEGVTDIEGHDEEDGDDDDGRGWCG